MRLSMHLVLALLVLGARPAAAEPDENARAEARKYLSAGLDAYNAGQYALAVEAWSESYRLFPHHQTRFNIAQASRLQFYVDENPRWIFDALRLYRAYLAEVKVGGRRKDAIEHVQTLEALAAARSLREGAGQERERSTQLYVTSRTPGALARVNGGEAADLPLATDVKPGTHVVEVEAPGYFPSRTEWVAIEGRLVVAQVELEPRPALVTIDARDDARLFVDGVHIGAAPLEGAATIPAGEHIVTATLPGRRSVSRRVLLEKGQSTQLSLAEMERTDQRVAAHVLLGSAAAATVAGTIAGVIAYNHQERAISLDPRRHPGKYTSTAPYTDARDARDSTVTAATVIFSSAAVLGVAGAMLYLLDTPEVPAPPIVLRPFATEPAPADTLEARP